MLQTTVAATYVSPLDDPEVHEIALFTDHFDRKLVARELLRLKSRSAAHSVWELDTDMHDLLKRGWERWLIKRNGALPFALVHAYRVATQRNGNYFVRESAVRGYIMQWLYSEIHPQLPEFSEAILYEALLKAPNSNMAQIARIALLSEYQAVQAELAEKGWPSNDVPATIVNRLAKIRSLSPEALSDDDPMAWLPYDDYDRTGKPEDDG